MRGARPTEPQWRRREARACACWWWTIRETSFFWDFHPFEARRKILGRIRQALKTDGYLFLGATETTLHADDAFERVAVERSWAYRLRRS